MTYDTAKMLAKELRESEEYKAYCVVKERALENETTRALIDEYHRLQIQAQAATVTGGTNDEMLAKLQKIGEVLQFDANASAFLMAEFRLNRVLGDVYKILAEAIDIDLSSLEA
ncbi:MAG: YlbF family regulator [Clostridia bacterium]